MALLCIAQSIHCRALRNGTKRKARHACSWLRVQEARVEEKEDEEEDEKYSSQKVVRGRKNYMPGEMNLIDGTNRNGTDQHGGD